MDTVDRKLKQAIRFYSRTVTPWQRMRCADCGKPNAERHHRSYAGFAVIWLCRRCHAKEHASEYARPRARDGKFEKL